MCTHLCFPGLLHLRLRSRRLRMRRVQLLLSRQRRLLGDRQLALELTHLGLKL